MFVMMSSLFRPYNGNSSIQIAQNFYGRIIKFC